MTGVIGHIANPSAEEAAALAVTAEDAGARWIGLADAFWWRDVWMLLSRVATVTDRIELGPAMTNAYLRHPFHTVSALATLHQFAPGRVFCGLAAGGSEVTAAARVGRRDAPERATELVATIRSVGRGEALDADSGRRLDLPLPATPVLMAGRGDRMLRAAGAWADRVLLWAIPDSDLERSVEVVIAGAGGRADPPQLIWAPLVRHADVAPQSLGHVAVYAALNTRPGIQRTWSLGPEQVDAIRRHLVAGDTATAIELVPSAAMQELIIDPDDRDRVVERARRLGVTEIAVPGFAVGTLPMQLAWAAEVEREIT